MRDRTEQPVPVKDMLATVCHVNDRYPARVLLVVGVPGKQPREVLVDMLKADGTPNGRTRTFTLRKNGGYAEKGSDHGPWLYLGEADSYQAPEI